MSISNNRLWESHRLILPEMREKVIHSCIDCQFLIQIQGREETKWGCVVSIPKYGQLRVKVPEKLQAIDVLYLVGREGLKQVVDQISPWHQTCGLFRKLK